MSEIPRNIVFYEHVLDGLKKIPDECVQTVCTSPPYWGLRKYTGDQERIWGGDKNCQHNWKADIRYWDNRHASVLASEGKDEIGSRKDARKTERMGDFCSLCGCWRGALGLEPTPEMYCAHLVEIFREVKRVLRKDGTFFLNIADSYAGGGRGIGYGGKQDSNRGSWGMPSSKVPIGLKAKDLCGIPWRVAFALQEDDWFLRSAIIWRKINSMPESVNGWRWEQHRVKDKATKEWHDCPGCKACASNDGLILRKGSWRPTKSYEFIFMFSKSAIYYADAEAVREPLADATLPRMLRGVSENHKWLQGADGQTQHTMAKPRKNIRKEFEQSMSGAGTSFKGHSGYVKEDGTLLYNPAGRNLRDCWEFSTEPFSGAHFAVFPTELPAKSIKAATPEKVCPHCGAPWARIVKRLNKSIYQEIREKSGKDYHDSKPLAEAQGVAFSCGKVSVGNTRTETGGMPWYNKPERETLGWRPTCKCPANDGNGKAIVLDPFAGSGTTLAVAAKLGRDYLGIEISKEYEPLIQARLAEAEQGLTPADQKAGQNALF